MSVIHSLKIGPLFFDAVANGEKRAEVRINDRDFKCGDFLILREWAGEYTGRKLTVKVTHILPLDGLVVGAGNWVVMSIATIQGYDIQSLLDATVGGGE
ncbi:DUF3850 domain-containing protein [Salmonella enterica]|uniref:DUF3850 domain-containing protein n=1 Tax=Enterobacteriaceae TaxID=543 RepID=UPI0009AEFC5D|nr:MULTISPECIES: DUF3850 domain-containing protein [Enterobacteriaceae]EAT1700371.1 DUF3850 domain-containing protein [Salmonella enterica]MDE9709493.1 DUF3850 domain-containing protein [Citrobacter portucalensis]EAT3611483.1 DUF3850 domain-containing protein [Salmonella enterica]EDD5389756.1 DUF3850 domain-containing protein [Salmonella enterica subsp. enterica serovar Enteritidis]EEI7367453.1 DUF3850 domain-containing protein [Salmonella enterica]